MNELDPAIRREFEVEAAEQLEALEEDLLALEENPDDQARVASLFRNAHTLKGNARVVGLAAAEAIAHVLEDALEALRDGRLRLTDALTMHVMEAIDALAAAIAEGLAGNPERPAPTLALGAHVAAHAAARGAPLVDLPASSPAGRSQTLRVEVTKLDRALDLCAELSVLQGLFARSLGSKEDVQLAQDGCDELGRLTTQLYDQVMQLRTVRLGALGRLLARTVRELSRATGKRARFELSGDEVEVDTRLVELLRAPLTHMVRNAVDHGIEHAEERRAAGKPAIGRVRLDARREGDHLIVQLNDDGTGVQRARIRERARELGVEGWDRLADRELFELLFRPGFSTARQVTPLSGRGVGMNVVRENVQALRGTIEMASPEGQGTTVTIRVPLNLVIVQGFAVSSAGTTYILPAASVWACADLPGGGDSGVRQVRGVSVPYRSLGRALGLSAHRPERQMLVAFNDGVEPAGIAVDAILGERQTVVRPLSRYLGMVRTVSGSAVLADGSVGLVLDGAALAARLRRSAGAERR